MNIHGRVVSLSFLFPHPPEDKTEMTNKKRRGYQGIAYIAASGVPLTPGKQKNREGKGKSEEKYRRTAKKNELFRRSRAREQRQGYRLKRACIYYSAAAATTAHRSEARWIFFSSDHSTPSTAKKNNQQLSILRTTIVIRTHDTENKCIYFEVLFYFS